MELGVCGGVCSDLEERPEEVVQHLLKVLQQTLGLVHIVQPWHLQPNGTLSPHIIRQHVFCNGPV